MDLLNFLNSEFVQGAIAGGLGYMLLSALAYALPQPEEIEGRWRLTYRTGYRLVHYLAVNLDRANRKLPPG